MSEQASKLHSQARREGEIRLVELAVVLWQQRWLIAGVTAGCIVLGMVYALVRPAIYEFTTTVEIGTKLEGSATRPIESAEAVVSKLERNYIPEAIRTYEAALLEDNGSAARGLSVKVSHPRETNLVILSSKAPAELGEYYIRLHDRVVDRLAANHERDSRLERIRIENDLELAELELDALTDERVLKVERNELQNEIVGARNKLEQLSDQEGLLQAGIDNLEVQEGLIAKRLEELAEYVTDARVRSSGVQAEVRGGTEGLALMLINNEMQRDIDRQTELEERIRVEIPESRAALRSELQDIQRQQALQRDVIGALEAEYEKLLLDQELRVPKARARVRELAIRLEGLRETRAVLPPQPSLSPVGAGFVAIVVLAAMLGGILGLIAAGLVVFMGLVRDHLNQRLA